MSWRRMGEVCLVIMAVGLMVLPASAGRKRGRKAEKKDEPSYEMIIKVKPKTIAMPGNVEIAKVPLSAARIRSTDLRKLNSKYNAVRIERLFELKKGKEKAGGTEGVLVSKGGSDAGEEVDLSNLFTKETRKKLLSEEKKCVEAKDIYLLTFEPEKDVEMKEVVAAYKKLAIVLYAKHVERDEKKDEKKKD